MASYYPMVKNSAQRIIFPLLDADGDPVGGATNLDSEYSLDGAAFSDCTNEATNITSGGSNTGIYYLDLQAGETNGDCVCIQVKSDDAKTTVLVFYTSAQSLDTVDGNVDTVNTNLTALMADVGDASGSTLGSIYAILGNPAANAIKTTVEDIHDTDLPAVKTDTGNIVTDTDEIQGKLPTNKIMGSSVVTDKDDEIDAIKAKTDLIGASVALEAGGNLAAVLADTNELQSDWANGGRLDNIIDACALEATVAALNDISADDVWDEVMDANAPANADTARKIINIIAAVLGGKSSGGGTATNVFRDTGDTKNRVSATVDADGNRTAVGTLDGT